jgi:hypothetical protein
MFAAGERGLDMVKAALERVTGQLVNPGNTFAKI